MQTRRSMMMVIAAIALFTVCLFAGSKPSQAQTIRYQDNSSWWSAVSGTSSGPVDPYARAIKSSPSLAVPYTNTIVRVWFKGWKSGQNSARVSQARVYFRVKVGHNTVGASPDYSGWYEVGTVANWYYIDVYGRPGDSFTLQTYTTTANFSGDSTYDQVYTNNDYFQVCWN